MKVIRIINGENSPSIYSYGYYCPSSETSYYCGGGSSDYICSNDSTRLTNNAQKLLCPSSSSYCNTQSYSITDAGSTIFFKTNEMSTSVVCWYYFEYSTSAISSLRFTQPSSRSASFEVYLEKTNSNYTYMGTLWSTMNVSYSSSTDKYVWLLVTPLYPIDSIYMSVYANPVSSDSSSSNNKSVINIVITFSMAFVVILLAAIACCVAYKLKSRCIQNKYFNNENRNLHARNSRTMMYNHASDLSIIIDEQSRENMNQSLPSSFQPRLELNNSGGFEVPSQRANNPLNQNQMELGVPVNPNFQPQSDTRVVEGRRVSMQSNSIFDGAELPVYHAKS